MSRRIERFAPTLKLLHRYTNAQKKKWMKQNLDREFVFCMCECVKNLLKGKVPLSQAQKRSLARRKKVLREFVKKKVSLDKKRRIIQTGGFLGAILGPVVSILSGLLGGRN